MPPDTHAALSSRLRWKYFRFASLRGPSRTRLAVRMPGETPEADH